jgi:hypothetical protein
MSVWTILVVLGGWTALGALIAPVIGRVIAGPDPKLLDEHSVAAPVRVSG